MLTIPEATYQELADRLRKAIEGLSFYNGSVELDTEEYHACLTCTVIVVRSEEMVVMPVWWEFHLHQANEEQLTNFSWRELNKYLKSL